MDYFEIHLVEHCNLKCKACDNYSSIAEEEYLDIENFENDMKRMRELFSGIHQVGAKPNKKAIELFADFNFYDEGETQKLAAPKGLLYYILHLKDFKKDFLKSRWKIGFLKKMLKIF